MNWASKGAKALSESDPLKAAGDYTNALLEHPTSPDYFIQRSTAFTRLKPPRHDLALQDAEFAVLLAQKRAKRETIQAAQQRRVVSLHGLGQYADAQYILTTMEKWRLKEDKPGKMQGDMWAARVQNKLKSIPDEQRVVTVQEYPEVSLPNERGMKEVLKTQLKSDGSYRFEGEGDKPTAESTVSENTNTVAVQPPAVTSTSTDPSASTTTTSVLSKVRHEWYQNPKSVIVTLYAKGVDKTKVELDLKSDSVFLSLPHPTNPHTDFTFSLDPLFAFIDPASSKVNVMSTKIELTLAKSLPGQKWPGLEGTAPLQKSEGDAEVKAAVLSTLQTKPQAPISAPSYPTSSRTGPKNWDKLATDLTAKKGKSDKSNKNSSDPESEAEDIESDFEGGDAVDGFFKKLYAGADDDTRRAMMKSFQESNGTSLSTNWAEVGKKRVDPVVSKDD